MNNAKVLFSVSFSSLFFLSIFGHEESVNLPKMDSMNDEFHKVISKEEPLHQEESLLRLCVAVKQGCDTDYDIAIKAAQQGTRSKNLSVIRSACELFNVLIEKDQGLKEATEAAQLILKSEDWCASDVVIGLFNVLVEKNYEFAFKGALETAVQGMQSLNDLVIESALILLNKLVRKGYCDAFGLACKAVQQGIHSKVDFVRSKAAWLHMALVEKDHNYGEAIKDTNEFHKIISKEKQLCFLHQEESLVCLLPVVQQGCEAVYEVAIKAAQQGMQSKNLFVIKSARKLFDALIEKDQGLKEATEAAQLILKSEDWWAEDVAISLFWELVEKNYEFAFEGALEAAVQGMQSLDDNVIELALILLNKLIKSGYCDAFGPACNAAQQGMHSNVDFVRAHAMWLHKALVEKDQNYGEAIKGAQEGMLSENWQERGTALKLFKALFEKGQGFEEAIQVGLQGMGGHKHEREGSLELFIALVEQGYQPAFVQALQAAQQGMQSSALLKALVEQGYQPAFKVVIGMKEKQH